MREHDSIRETLLKKHFKKFNSFLKRNYRIYSIELPLRTKDGTKYADLVLEDEENNSISVVEFKSDKVDSGVCEQLERYVETAHKQVHRSKDKYKGFIIGPEFSSHEIEMCKKFKFIPIQYDYKYGHLRIPNE